jgi:hypothetical protein
VADAFVHYDHTEASSTSADPVDARQHVESCGRPTRDRTLSAGFWPGHQLDSQCMTYLSFPGPLLCFVCSLSAYLFVGPSDIVEMRRIRQVLFDKNNRIFGPYWQP